MTIRKLLGLRKHRKYPIQYDDGGQTLRARSFALFEEGMRPPKVAAELQAKRSTVDTYFRQWKHLGPGFEKQLAYFKRLLNPLSPDRDRTMELLSKALKISGEELETILSKPNGLRRLMTSKYYLRGHADRDHKHYTVFRLALVIADHLVQSRGTFEDLSYLFKKWLKESADFRAWQDDDIRELNQEIAFTRGLLEAEAKAEREGRASRRERLTPQEIDAVIRLGLQAKAEEKMRNLEMRYLLQVVELMAEHKLTMEQAEEKIVADLVEKGDRDGADAIRRYQQFIHDIRPDDRSRPPPASQPPPA
jgi:hypothetical protein